MLLTTVDKFLQDPFNWDDKGFIILPIVLVVCFLDTTAFDLALSRDTFLPAPAPAPEPPLPPCIFADVAIPWGKMGVGAAVCAGGSIPTMPSAGVDVTMPFCCDVCLIKGVMTSTFRLLSTGCWWINDWSLDLDATVCTLTFFFVGSGTSYKLK